MTNKLKRSRSPTEYPQPNCTNCDGDGWCVCAKCRKNNKTLEKITKLVRSMRLTEAIPVDKLDSILFPRTKRGNGN